MLLKRFDFEARGCLAGLALTAPFIANPLPWKFWAIFVAVPLALHVLRYGVASMRLTPLMILAGLLAVSHLIQLVVTPTPFARDVLRGVVTTGAACCIWLCVRPQDRPKAIDSFFTTIMAVAVLATLLGLLKFVLLANGIIIPWLIDKCGVGYPQGAALCGDYTLFGLLLMAGAIGILRQVASKGRLGAFSVLALTLIAAAIALSGSRRAMALAPMVPVYWCVLAYRAGQLARALPGVVLIISVAGFAAMPIATDIPLANADGGPASRDVVITHRSLTSLAGTIAPETAFGFDTRLDRWNLAGDFIRQAPLVGVGFAYHKVFSCRFVSCAHIDYPHAPLLSEWMISGVIGLVLALTFYGLIGWGLWSARYTGWVSGVSPLTLVTLATTAISGDTVLSLPHMLIMGLMITSLPENKCVAAVGLMGSKTRLGRTKAPISPKY